MKQVLAIALLTFKLTFRRGGWILAALVVGSGLFMFHVAHGDGVLANELQLRLRFALGIATALLSLALLWQANLSLRGDLDLKRLHLLTSYPVPRAAIYIGKWLGLWLFAAVNLVVLGLTLAGGVWYLLRTWPDRAAVATLPQTYGQTTRACAPLIPDARQLAAAGVSELRESGRWPPNRDEQEVARELQQAIRHSQQLVPRDGERRWLFVLQSAPRSGAELVFHARCYAHGREAVTGDWSLAVTDDAANYYTVATQVTTARPGQTLVLRFPAAPVRPNGHLTLTFHGRGNPDLVFPNTTGLTLFYAQGSWLGNALRFLAVMLAHLALVIAAGLTVATAFTLSVSCFVSVAWYGVALAAEFFQRFLREFASGTGNSLDQLGAVGVKCGLFFTTGLELPAAVAPLSQAVLLTPGNLGMASTREIGSALLWPVRVFSDAAAARLTGAGADLALGCLAFFLLVGGLGIWLLSRKELDRIH